MSFRTHPDYRALYAAVCADPEDDTVRLVLADWLEEREPWSMTCWRCGGQREYVAPAFKERERAVLQVGCRECEDGTVPDPEPAALAEFIRAGVELARHEPWATPACPHCGCDDGYNHNTGCHYGRAGELLAQWEPRWRECPCPACGGEGGDRDTAETCRTCRGTGDLLKQRDGQQGHSNIEPRPVTFARGFVDSVSCTLAESFRGDGTPSAWAKAVVGAVPTVQRLVLTDRKPRTYGIHGPWWSDAFAVRPLGNDIAAHDWFLPPHLFAELDGDYEEGWAEGTLCNKHYPTEAAAVEALARGACRMVRNATSGNPTAPAEQSNAG